MPRYLILKIRGVLILLSAQIIFAYTVMANNQDTSRPAQHNTDYIDPTIGNVGQLLEPTRPTIHLPNQLIRVYPIRKDFLDDQISSFPLSAVSHRLGEVFAIKPFVGIVSSESWSGRMSYDRDLETIHPWYYSTYLLNDGITVEFTPGKKTGIYRFSFPEGKDNAILFDVYNKDESSWHFIADSILTGMETYHKDIRIYMYGVFNTAGKGGVADTNHISEDKSITSKIAKAYIYFPKRARQIEFKYAISFISPQQAQRNYKEELSTKTFDNIEKNAKDAWSSSMSQIQVEGGTFAQRRSFYTALYRCNERMVNITEDSFYYSGYNKQVNHDTRAFYVDDWSWDTYLALHPLRTLLHPSMEEDMLSSYVRMYQQSNWMPTFPVIYGDYACMNGFHSSIIFLDAYRKGLRNFDIQSAYSGIRKNATDATMLPWRNGIKTELDDFYHTKGYFPAISPGEKETIVQVDPFEKRQAVAVTLGHSYDDWAVGQLARDLGKTEDFKLFNNRGLNYRNLWNNEVRFFIPKDRDGNWINIDPKFDGGLGGRDYYDENNGWTYLWQVQHDIPGLILLLGGKKPFESKLDQLFREGLGRSKYAFWSKFPDATALVGQFSMGNEPSFHIPYLYNYTDSPWKTQQRIRMLLATWFTDNIFGIPGDEDGGGMSAFVVFSSMGFYPVVPGVPIYTIGSPVFSKVTIRLENGKTFKMIAHSCSQVNKYIQRARFNGSELNTPFFSHEQLTNGGTLELFMGPLPNKKWGIK